MAAEYEGGSDGLLSESTAFSYTGTNMTGEDM